ncbi:uncharacterized protein MEPE_05078 [Melanopsichium pennsylvanicum]|uniref:Integral membrane protein n=2 Tax=Melanopsichium pennsylvanicum TaxID=63383 RepID=A0AAJ5C7C5_9BASI|nr:conserved hypothetical protein [Melanopsichium pennsylvanicum 4]SNX86369.1 uncharacterized protein MEPE_05078 [Melanopsichium pennsylvanicum]
MQLTRPKTQSFFVLMLAILCLATTISNAFVPLAAVQLEQPSGALQQSSSQADAGKLIFKRHADHGDENDEEEAEHEDHLHSHGSMAQEHRVIPVTATVPVEQLASVEEHQHVDQPSHMSSSSTHTHSHQHTNDGTMEKGTSPASIPDASSAGPSLLPLPVWHHHGGHSHGGSGPVQEHLNETALFLSKGPDPLSYMEWDFGYGLGSSEQLKRFVSNVDVLNGRGMMGVVDGRWRKLFDENSSKQREEIANDIKSRLAEKEEEEPRRHGILLVLHVVTAVLSCFVLLPTALVLRAAQSSLAPLVSLFYLAVLGGSMFLSIIYKALTPRLYQDNSHGSMGWAIFWISLITLGSDVVRLMGQIWSAILSLHSSKRRGNTWLPTNSFEVDAAPKSWKGVMGTILGRKTVHARNSESYDALEEQSMLSQAARSDDAEELDVEKHMQHGCSPRIIGVNTRSGSGSGSPHRVHFDDRFRGASAESLVEPVNETGSGSTLASNLEQHHHHHRRGSPVGSDTVMVASPTTTACNTPRNSMLGHDRHFLPPLKTLKSNISLWRNEACQEETSQHEMSLAPPKSRPGRLDTVRTVMRYTHVVAARSLPILAFATSYTGVAVYTGSCRGGYKNVCLAHGIKGGIFFWFGLLTFGRYLGAYADIGWAWNKRPSPTAAMSNKTGVAGWRKNVPSAEFIECAVIFVYGASNTWMERFGAKRGDPYTIKQIQHISIAVMFWFAGLMGMLLETKLIRDMLSFPIAYYHVSALPLSEIRRRRRRNHGRIPSCNPTDGADEDLDELVDAQTQPASYSASFNPFPALVIGVTGVAMAAHHQDYIYEVEIHMLWGELLGGFALLRCLTYFLLWLRPPTASILPSRPPTEAMAAFSLCCGGLVFMLSSEEVSFAAMRSGYGDFMAILNVAVAVVALLFCWTTGLLMIKGWAVRQEIRRDMHEREGVSHTSHFAENALHLDVADMSEERMSNHMRASVVAAQIDAAEREPVFVLDDEEDEE